MDAPRLRFAPSPSGFLHIGGARTALFCWLLARRHGGTFILRVEDTDAARTTDESIAAIVEGMEWLGLDWDEGPRVGGPHAPYFQSGRKEIYGKYIDQLVAEGKVYRCYCTPEQLQAKREKAMAEGRPPIYDGEWRDRDPSEWPPGEPYVLRLRAPTDGETVVDDLVKGRVVFPNKELGDQVVVRSNGDPLYNFVVVIDDMLMGMTHVVRGDDHLSNTPKQIQLYDALGVAPPVFAHVPMILGADKKRLSKRHGATSVTQYRDEGFLADAMVNYLARLGWSHGDDEFFSDTQAREWFGLEGIGKSPARFDTKKLENLSGQHIAVSDDAALRQEIQAYLQAAGETPLDDVQSDGLERAMYCLKDRARTFPELLEKAHFILTSRPLEPDSKAAKALANVSDGILEELTPQLQNASWSRDDLEALLNQFAEAHDTKFGKLAAPLRAVLAGRAVTPSVFDMMLILGREETLARLKDATG